MLEVVFFEVNCRAHDVACHTSDGGGSMCHPSDAEAWRHFDQMYPNFAEAPRNVRFGLCTDSFAPHGQYGRTYSCWSVIITPYNLPPGMCMSTEYMFITMVIPRPEPDLDERRPNVMPKAVYTLSKEQTRRMHGMKSHDCHVFMQKLIPIVFREMLPKHVRSALTEVSLLFQSICSITPDVHKLHELENTVAIILCNLEKIFPPAFFDSMEHLIVHLSYEARVGGPVQYRWMYPLKGSCRVEEEG
ncbi:UNVERIFIED_CONTAM: hypothetical protein Slati_0824800 [Sesamum latifolium]|uniref:DUF4218 domain-containing protein n=1 Tax=Sesamum latifolium TaxID=2727402 RepID=A0AAW2XRE7_9LAMI